MYTHTHTHSRTGLYFVVPNEGKTFLLLYVHSVGYMVAQLVEALPCRPKGRGFDFRWNHWLNPSGRTLALRSIRPVIEIRNGDVSWAKRRPRADNFPTFMCRLSRNSGNINLLVP